MIRRLLYVAMSATVAVAILSVSASSQGPSPNNTQFWGVWVHRVHVGSGMYIPSLVTIHFDGVIGVTPGTMFGGLQNATRRLSPVHSVWEKTGPKSIGATSLFFTFDTNGLLTGYQRNRCSLEFADDSNKYEGVEFMETLSCPSPLTCPDPLDPAATWTPVSNMPAGGFPVSANRLTWVPTGPLNPYRSSRD